MGLIFERSLATEATVVVLRGVNDEITYDEGARRAELPRSTFIAVLPSAQRILERENIVFGRIKGIGLRRLSESERAKKTEADKKKLMRASSRAGKHAAQIDMTKLAPREQLMVTTNRTIFSLLHRVTNTPDNPVHITPVQADLNKLIELVTKNAETKPDS